MYKEKTMNSLLNKANSDPVLAGVRVDSSAPLVLTGGTPVLATPAAVVGFAAGVGVVAGLAGAFAAGAAAGRAAIGGTSPTPS
jgi:hypothetical protein